MKCKEQKPWRPSLKGDADLGLKQTANDTAELWKFSDIQDLRNDYYENGKRNGHRYGYEKGFEEARVKYEALMKTQTQVSEEKPVMHNGTKYIIVDNGKNWSLKRIVNIDSPW